MLLPIVVTVVSEPVSFTHVLTRIDGWLFPMITISNITIEDSVVFCKCVEYANVINFRNVHLGWLPKRPSNKSTHSSFHREVCQALLYSVITALYSAFVYTDSLHWKTTNLTYKGFIQSFRLFL